MSWTSLQTAIRIPSLVDNLPNLSYPVWIDGNGYFLYYTSAYGWIISDAFGISFVVDGNTYRPLNVNFNGFCAYGQDPSGLFTGYGVWYDFNFGWVYSDNIGYPRWEEWFATDIYSDPTGAGQYNGNYFFTGILPSYGGSANFVARGGGRGTVLGEFNGTPKTITTYFEYWQCVDVQFGEYEPKGDATGDSKWFGNPQWKDQNNIIYTRSTAQTSGKYTYGNIYYDTSHSKWIIGTYGNTTGWWEGSEPNKDGSVQFLFKVPSGSILTGEDLTISFNEYVIGNDTQIIYLSEASRWV